MSAGGWIRREHERLRADPTHIATVVNAHRADCVMLARLARDHCTLRIPLLDVLGYTKAWRDQYDGLATRQMLYELNR